jgi:glycosyltransferase involved in cell wall biosynthesis
VLAATTRGPLLAIAHGGDVALLARARLLPAAMALLAARRARLAFVSSPLRERAIDATPAPLRRRLAASSIVQPMGVDRAHLASIATRRRPRHTGEPATLVVLARLVPIKGVEVAIDALRRVRTPARLIVAGDGPLRAALATRAAGLPVELVGAVGAAARDDLLTRADAVVVPSVAQGDRTEGMPLVALEALAAGVPLVASATGGLVALPPDLCRLTPPGDTAALAAAIDATLGAPPSPPDPGRLTTFVPDWAQAGERLWAHLRHR